MDLIQILQERPLYILAKKSMNLNPEYAPGRFGLNLILIKYALFWMGNFLKPPRALIFITLHIFFFKLSTYNPRKLKVVGKSTNRIPLYDLQIYLCFFKHRRHFYDNLCTDISKADATISNIFISWDEYECNKLIYKETQTKLPRMKM